MTANELKYNWLLKFDSLFGYSAPAYDDRQVSLLLTEAQWRVFLKKYNPFGNKYQKGFEGNEQRRRELEQLIKAANISCVNNTGSIFYTGTTTTGSKNIPLISSVTGLNPGLPITGSGIPANTTIVTVGTNFITISNNATASSTVPLTSGLGKSTDQFGIHPNGVLLDLPEGFLYAIEESAKSSASGTKEITVKPITHDEYLSNINNPYKNPYSNLVWRMDFSRSVQPSGVSPYSRKRTELITNGATSLLSYRLRYLSAPSPIVVDDITLSNQRHCLLDESIHSEIVDEAVVIAAAAVKPQEYQIGAAEIQRNN